MIGLLKIPWAQTVIYEVHVKGFTINHPDVPTHLREPTKGWRLPLSSLIFNR